MPLTFAIGSRPVLSDDDARDLAEMLGRRTTVAAQELAGRIRAQAAVNAAIDLSRDELEQVVAELNERPDLLVDAPALSRLHDEAVAALGG